MLNKLNFFINIFFFLLLSFCIAVNIILKDQILSLTNLAYFTLYVFFIVTFKIKKFFDFKLFFLIIYLTIFFLSSFVNLEQFGSFAYKSNQEIAEDRGLFSDKRSKYEVLTSHKEKGEDIKINFRPLYFAKENNNKEIILPLTVGVPNSKNVWCNEDGTWRYIELDKYGFPNDNEIYDYNEFDIIFLGDSFTRGACVDKKFRIQHLLKKSYGYKVINLALAGGPVSQYAIYKEYGSNFKSKYVIVNLYEGNDLFDLNEELNTSHFKKYLDKNYHQNLFKHQKKSNKIVKNYLEKKFINYSNIQKKLKKSSLEILILELYKIVSLEKVRAQLARLKNNFQRKKQEEKFKKKEIKDYELVLINLKELVEKNNSNLIINIIPTWDRFYFNKGDNYRLKQDLIKIFKKHNVEYWEFEKHLRKQNINPIKYYTFERFNHFNIEGYKLLSEFINIQLIN